MTPAVARQTCTSIALLWRPCKVVVAIVLILTVGTTRLAGQSTRSTPMRITDIRLGFAGVARVGSWIPISAHFRSEDDESHEVSVSWVAPDPEANECRFTDRKLHEVDSTGTTIHGLIRLGRATPAVVMEVRRNDRVVAHADVSGAGAPIILASSTRLVVGAGANLDLDSAVRSQPSMRHRDVAVARLVDASLLPNEPLAYDSVDVIVLVLSDTSFFSAVTDRQWEALTNWVLGGGRIVISLDPAEPITASNGQRLLELIGTTPVGVERQRDTTGLETFAGVEQRLDVAVRARNEPWDGLEVVRLAPTRAKAIAFDGLGTGRSNWIQQSTAGLGIVTVVSFDLNAPVLAQWPGTPQLVGKILELALGIRELPAEARGRELAHWGYSDLMGQLRMALDQVVGVRVASFSLVAAAIVLYIVLVSAGDYFLLRHVLRRFGWTWLTLPLLIGATCFAGYAWSRSWKGTEQRGNQVDFVDMDLTSGTARMQSWCHLFSPHARRLDLRWHLDDSVLSVEQPCHQLCSWEGMPGVGFGGMESQATSPLFRYQYISLSERDGAAMDARDIRLLDVPMLAGSSRGFEGGALLRLTPDPPTPLRADSLNQLQGTVRNPLPVRLRDCALCFDRWYYELGNLEPGGQMELTSRHQPLDLKARLTRKRIVDAKEVTSPWDPAATDIARIAEMMMFHQAAGGTLFTGLRHDYRDRLDFSQHLLLQTAVVVGRPTEPLARFLVGADEQPLHGDRRVTLLRFLVPVEPLGSP